MVISDAEVERICREEGKQQIAVWPDGSWCWPDGIEAMMIAGKSDDYAFFLIPIEYGPTAIEKHIEMCREEQGNNFCKATSAIGKAKKG